MSSLEVPAQHSLMRHSLIHSPGHEETQNKNVRPLVPKNGHITRIPKDSNVIPCFELRRLLDKFEAEKARVTLKIGNFSSVNRETGVLQYAKDPIKLQLPNDKSQGCGKVPVVGGLLSQLFLFDLNAAIRRLAEVCRLCLAMLVAGT